MQYELSEDTLDGRVLLAAEKASADPALDVWVSPGPVSPVTIDGGTRVMAAGAGVTSRALARAVRQCDGAQSKPPRGGVRVRLESGRTVRVIVTPATVTVEWPGQAWARVSRGTGAVEAQARAEMLWASGGGVAGWVAWCVAFLGREFIDVFGVPSTAWRVTNLEICQDFVGWVWAIGDAEFIIGARKGTTYSEVTRGPWAQTVAVGSRGSTVSVCLYDKSAEMGEHPQYYYRAVHARHGYTGGRVQRVEFRLSGKGLCWTARDADGAGAGTTISLRCPWTLHERVWGVWLHLVHSRRMVQAGRRDRAALDPRWAVVARASMSGALTIDAVQRGVQACRSSWEDAVVAAEHDIRRGAARMAVLMGADMGRTEAGTGAPEVLLAVATMALSHGLDGVWGRTVDRYAGLAQFAGAADRVRLDSAMSSFARTSARELEGARALDDMMARVDAAAPLMRGVVGENLFSHLRSAMRFMLKRNGFTAPPPAGGCSMGDVQSVYGEPASRRGGCDVAGAAHAWTGDRAGAERWAVCFDVVSTRRWADVHDHE